MPNLLSVGLVYDDTKNITTELQKLIAYFSSLDSEVISFKVSEDSDGERWLENLEGNLDFDLITNRYYGEIVMRLKSFHNITNRSMTISIHKEEAFFGYLLMFDLTQLENQCSLKTLNKLMTELAKGIYTKTKYNYAFCDHDAEIEYEPAAYKEWSSNYSLVIIPRDDEQFEIVKNAWNIDGITERIDEN